MSVLNTLADAILGWPWDFAGKVNPWALGNILEENAVAIKRASGVGVGGKTIIASPDVVAQRQLAAKREVENYLRSQNAHPGQLDLLAFLRDDLWSKIVFVLSLGVGIYFVTEVVKAYLSRR